MAEDQSKADIMPMSSPIFNPTCVNPNPDCLWYDTFSSPNQIQLHHHALEVYPPGYYTKWSTFGAFIIPAYNLSIAVSTVGSVASFNTLVSNLTVSIKVALLRTTQKAGIFLRAVVSNSHGTVLPGAASYRVYINVNDQLLELYEFTGGILRSSDSLTVSMGEWKTINAECKGEDISATCDTAEVAYSSSEGENNTYFAMYQEGGEGGQYGAEFDELCIQSNDHIPDPPP